MAPLKSELTYQRHELDSGIRVVTERMPQIRSLALGFWFNTGSRDEPDELSGISHFLEHMNFKGTRKRSAAAIVRQIEGRGGHLNAFTSKEATCYYARVIDSQLAPTLAVIADITRNSLYEPDDLERERKVILEELKNLEDTPDDLVFEQFEAQVFSGHSLGWSVLGQRESLQGIDQEKLIHYRNTHYTGPALVVAAAGNLEHNSLVRLVERHFDYAGDPPRPRTSPDNITAQLYRQDLYTNTQQAHICWGCRAYRYDDPRKYSLLVMNTLLGDGMSSRLFQNIRERHGLAYSVFSFFESYLDTGLFGVYAGTEPRSAKAVLRLIEHEVENLTQKPISNGLLERTKDQLKGNLLLGLESPTNRMYRLARMELYTGEWRSLDDVTACIDAVTVESVQEAACDLLTDKPLFNTILWPNL